MDDGDKSNNDMRNGLAKSGDVGEGEVSEEGVDGADYIADPTPDDYIEAPNLISNGICNACRSDAAGLADTQGIKCWDCKNIFHAISCSQESYCVSAPSNFTQTLKSAVTNDGKFSSRFGQFLWMCNFCINKKEFDKTATQNDRVTILDKKIDKLGTTFSKELMEMKRMLEKLPTYGIPDQVTNVTTPVISSVNVRPATTINAWNDKYKVDMLKQKLVLKNNNGSPVDPKVLEKTCVDNGVAVIRSEIIKDTQDTVVIVNSLKDAKILKDQLSKSSPLHTVTKVATRTPTIIVTGMDKEYEPAEIVRMIKLQNKTIGDFIDNSSSEEDKMIDVKAVHALKSNASVFKATVRVSNAIRALIQKQSNRLFIGYKRVCNVWDSYYVTRCYKCQQYGHGHKLCTNPTVCGHCAGSHDTRACEKLEDDSAFCCINCKGINNPRYYDHAAYYSKCPVLMDCQSKLKSSIPFYQRNK